MRPDLLLPVALLILMLIGMAIALAVDGRDKKMQRRIESLMPSDTGSGVPPERGRSIRIVRPAGHRFNSIVAALLCLPLGLPKAHVIPPRLVAMLGIIAAAAAALGAHLYLDWPAAAALGAATCILLLRMIFGWERGKYQKTLTQQLPDAIEMVVSATRAGLPVSEAFRAVSQEMPAPTRDEFATVMNEISLGTPPEEALLAVHRRTLVTEYAIFAVTIGVQAKTGGRLAETIQNLAETVRYRLAIATRAHALAGEARVSAIILAGLPFVAGGLLTLIRPGYLDPLMHDPRGTRLLFYAVAGLLLGIWTMRGMIAKATRE